MTKTPKERKLLIEQMKEEGVEGMNREQRRKSMKETSKQDIVNMAGITIKKIAERYAQLVMINRALWITVAIEFIAIVLLVINFLKLRGVL